MSAPGAVERVRGWRGVMAALPPALVAGLVLSIACSAALTLYQAALLATDGWHAQVWPRVVVLSAARFFTGALFLAVGLGQLRERARGGERALVTLAAIVAALVVARPLVSAYLTFVDEPSPAWRLAFDRWDARVAFAAWVVIDGALVAVVSRRGRVGLAIAAGLLVSLALQVPVDAWIDLFYFDDRRQHPLANAAISIGLHLFNAATLLAAAWCLGRDSAPPDPRPGLLADGLARVEATLVARVLLAVGAALLTMLAIGGHSPGTMKVVLTVVPLAALATQVALVLGLLRAARGSAALRGRLTWSAALTVLASFAAWCQAITAYRVMRARWHHDHDAATAWLQQLSTAWPYLLPSIGLVGLLLLLWAVEHVRRTTPHHDPASPVAAGVWAIVGTASALALPTILLGRRVDVADVLLLTVLVAVANVVATLTVARACGKAAAALRNATR